ncbi:hypothetical protein ARMGADRAFT_1080215 [Armillaria gallica]|uniref:Uncharacterized protein n=1 Tax=Armillaria gallica TaxID=47427 RepID=A0A2H3DNG3_ARMGA|nr:hypothetical protein ARMGADRAFT_1080215 [Armillaria gallica]
MALTRLVHGLVARSPFMSLKEAERNTVHDSANQIDANCISWLYTTSSNLTIRQIALESVSGLRSGFTSGLLDVEMFSKDLVQEIHSCYPPHVPTSWQEPCYGAEWKAEVMWRTVLQLKQLDAELLIGRDLSFHRTITLDDPMLHPSDLSFTKHPALLATTTCVLGRGSSARRLLVHCLSGHLSDLKLPPFLWILLLRQARLQLFNYRLNLMQLALFEILQDNSFFLLGAELVTDPHSTTIAAPNKDMVTSMVDLLFDVYRTQSGNSRFHFISPQLELLLGFVLSVCEVSRQPENTNAPLPADVSERSRPSTLKWCPMLVQCLSQYLRRHKLPLGSEEETCARAYELRSIRDTLCRLVETRIISSLGSTTEEMNIRLTTFATLAPLFAISSPYNVVLEITSTPSRVFATNVVRTIFSATQVDTELEQDIHASASRLLLYCLDPQWQSVIFYQVFRDEHALQRLHHRIRFDGMATWKHIVITYISTIVVEPSFFALQEHELQLAYIYDPDNLCSISQVLLHNNRTDLVYALVSLRPQSSVWDKCIVKLLVWANNKLDDVHRSRTVFTIKDLGYELQTSYVLPRLNKLVL